MEPLRRTHCCNTPITSEHAANCELAQMMRNRRQQGLLTRPPWEAREVDPKTRPSREAVMMQVARAIASRSTCGRLQVGAVITLEGRILSTGYNGAPAGLPHCQHERDLPCDRAVHAEANAVAFAARHGIKTEEAELFTTHDPCLNCAMLVINAGVRTVRSAVRYRDQSGIELLQEARVLVFQHEEL